MLLIDKLVFYESFIHNFCENGRHVLKDNNIKHLLLAREYMIEARNEIKRLQNVELEYRKKQMRE